MKRITRNYCCVDCGGLIDRHVALYRSGKCRSCSQKGKILSLETKKKISLAHIGKKLSDEHKEKLRKGSRHLGGKDHPMFGRKHSKESRLKMSKSGKGKKFSKEHCLKISKAHQGKKRSKAHCLKIGLSKKGIKQSFEHRLKISLATSGKKSHLYIDGKGNMPYPLEFSDLLKLKVRQRDNFVCQHCLLKEKNHLRDNKQVNLTIHHIDYNKFNNKEDNLISLCVTCHAKSNFNRDYWFAYYKYIMENR